MLGFKEYATRLYSWKTIEIGIEIAKLLLYHCIGVCNKAKHGRLLTSR